MVAGALCIPALAVAADPIRIALIDPFSGPFALQGEWSLRHIQMTVDEINVAGGVLGGRKFEIKVLDNKGSPQEALVAFKYATDQGIRFVSCPVERIGNSERKPFQGEEQLLAYLSLEAPGRKKIESGKDVKKT